MEGEEADVEMGHREQKGWSIFHQTRRAGDVDGLAGAPVVFFGFYDGTVVVCESKVFVLVPSVKS